MISQSSNNLNLTFVVDEEVVDALLPHLHDLLIGAGALRTDDSALFGPSWQMLYGGGEVVPAVPAWRSEEHTSALQSLMSISYAVFRSKKTKKCTARAQQ